jgi:hypothetical protein
MLLLDLQWSSNGQAMAWYKTGMGPTSMVLLLLLLLLLRLAAAAVRWAYIACLPHEY